MQRVNINDLEPVLRDDEPPVGYRGNVARIGEQIGGSMLSATLRELPPGQSVCPYHYEQGDEEWMLVLQGSPSVRHPGGEEVLSPGDIVCFPAGPDGAHKISNRSQESVRVFIFSTRNFPAVCVYPDSDKVGVFFEDGRDDALFRRSEAVEYFDGEPEQ